MRHQPGSDVGRVDRAVGRAAAGLGLGLPKQRRRVMPAAVCVSRGQDADDLSQHAAVAPKTALA